MLKWNDSLHKEHNTGWHRISFSVSEIKLCDSGAFQSDGIFAIRTMDFVAIVS